MARFSRVIRASARRTTGEQPTVFSLKSRRSLPARPSIGARYSPRRFTARRAGTSDFTPRVTGAPLRPRHAPPDSPLQPALPPRWPAGASLCGISAARQRERFGSKPIRKARCNLEVRGQQDGAVSLERLPGWIRRRKGAELARDFFAHSSSQAWRGGDEERHSVGIVLGLRD